MGYSCPIWKGSLDDEHVFGSHVCSIGGGIIPPRNLLTKNTSTPPAAFENPFPLKEHLASFALFINLRTSCCAMYFYALELYAGYDTLVEIQITPPITQAQQS